MIKQAKRTKLRKVYANKTSQKLEVYWKMPDGTYRRLQTDTEAKALTTANVWGIAGSKSFQFEAEKNNQGFKITRPCRVQRPSMDYYAIRPWREAMANFLIQETLAHFSEFYKRYPSRDLDKYYIDPDTSVNKNIFTNYPPFTG